MNVTDSLTTVAGINLPPHSFMAVLFDGTTAPDDPIVTNDQCAALVEAQTPMGIATAGNSSGTVVDSNGVPQTVRFSRPAGVTVYISVTCSKGPAWDDTATPAAVKAALAAYATANWKPGVSVIHAFLFGVVASVNTDPLNPQVADVTAITLGTAPSPSGTANLTMSVLQVATLIAANVSVTGV